MAFDKSPERILLEREIHTAHQKALAVAVDMVQNEYKGNFEAAFANSKFVALVQNTVKIEWDKYQRGYEKLEILEAREQFQAMRNTAEQLDVLSQHVPVRCRSLCYYPFSGVDFYFARVFKKLACEDIGFDMPQLSNMWWDPETYSKRRRGEIIALMKRERIIPSAAEIVCISGNAEETRKENDFNQRESVLLVKGGHDVLSFFEKRFKNKLKFGAVIVGSPVNVLSEIEDVLSGQYYTRRYSATGENPLAPYAMEFRDVHVFVRR